MVVAPWYHAPMSVVSLTKQQKADPCRIVRTHGHFGMTVIERSFARRDRHEMAFWEERGEVARLMARPPGRGRDFSRTLMEDFLSHAGKPSMGRQRVPTRQQQQEEDRILRLLWKMGAHRHPDRYAGWLSGMPFSPMFETLLDHGANPHAVDLGADNRRLPVVALMEAYSACLMQSRAPRPCFRLANLSPGQTDRSLPGAPGRIRHPERAIPGQGRGARAQVEYSAPTRPALASLARPSCPRLACKDSATLPSRKVPAVPARNRLRNTLRNLGSSVQPYN